MIKSEIIDNMVVRHWSDAGVKLRQLETGTLWNDAVDILPCRYTYEETDIPIDDEDIDDTEALAILTGGAT